MRELAVVVNNSNENVTVLETIDAIKNAGFNNVFVQWYDEDWIPNQQEQLNYIKKCGLKVIFAHLGYQNINDIWLDNEDGSKLVERYKNDIKICKENDIPLVIMHLTRKNNAPMYNEIGLNRIKEIVKYAKEIGVKVSFENTKIKGYLDYVFENIDLDNMGLCFDSGHYHAHFNDELEFDKYKNKIFAVHLHDNDGTSDQHLIPFDGNLDWYETLKKIKECNYNGPITMELCYRKEYLNMSIDEFYKKGFEVGMKLSQIIDKG